MIKAAKLQKCLQNFKVFFIFFNKIDQGVFLEGLKEASRDMPPRIYNNI